MHAMQANDVDASNDDDALDDDAHDFGTLGDADARDDDDAQDVLIRRASFHEGWNASIWELLFCRSGTSAW